MTARPDVDPSPLDRLSAYLQDITEALAAASTERDVIEIVLTPAVEALGAVAGIVLLVDRTDQQLKIAGSQGYENGAQTLWQQGSGAAHRLIADILRMKEATYFEHAGALKAAYPDVERRTDALTPTACAALPMFLDDRPYGMIVLDFTEPHDFTAAERRFLTILASQCALAMGRADVRRTLEERVEERTQQLDAERTALAAFVAFTEAVGTQADLPTLAREAIKVLLRRFPGASAIYYEEENTLWKGRFWSDNLRPELVEVICAGIPSETPIFAQVIQTRQAVFTNGWNPEREHVPASEDYHAAANYPLLIDGELHSILSIGLRGTYTWSEADQTLFRAVGRSLNLALERTETARRLSLQNAQLHARTQALEGFAELTKELALSHDPLTLIGRTQELVITLLPDAVCTYYEVRGGLWQLLSHRGELQNPAMLTALARGLPRGQTPNLDRPYDTRAPYYQDRYDPSTTEPAGDAVRVIRTSAALPVLGENQVRGVLVAGRHYAGAWTAEEHTILETIVWSLSMAMERAEGITTLARRTQELERSNEELERFAYIASHDLREPLRTVTSFAELLIKQVPDHNQKTARYVQYIQEGTARMSRLLEELLAFSRIMTQGIDRHAVSAWKVAAQVVHDLGAQIDRTGGQVMVDDLPVVQADETQLRQLLQNLISNALKFSVPGRPPVVHVGAVVLGNEARFSVTDNGMGIEPEFFERVFTIFQRLNRREDYEGTGMGLAIVRRIVERHDGRIWIESTPGQGTTFFFTLPLAK